MEINIPLVVFHILIVLSKEPDAKLPFANVTKTKTTPVCPVNVKINDPSGLTVVVAVVEVVVLRRSNLNFNQSVLV